MARVKRKATPARTTARRKNTRAKASAARRKSASVLDTALGAIPLSQKQWQGVFAALIIAGGLALAWTVAVAAGVPTMARHQVAVIAHDAGFEVIRVDVRGTDNLNERRVYDRVLDLEQRALPLVDLDMLREDLLTLPWVEDARVSRQLPDTLVVDIVEREPVAVLRKADRLVLVDSEGRELDVVSRKEAEDYLILAGAGSAERIQSLERLLQSAPALRPQIAEAEWIGNRRWNVHFKTGQVLALPEGERSASTALIEFAQLDGRNRLLGGKATSFDMRNPPRIYLREPGRAERALEEKEE
ncbi:MAG: cell division protein FtsQ [Sphingomonadales bacterium CG12_big_fil_rev_8_21_14_0_65_65_10]|uniref:cell division protein FtsQ/DivIB n=1 Tax=Blastomonas marina TaxID=1867408 RepID=UPI000CC0352D|nr:FtsQ-type POTRA domain-containing protein [Blastomonas marina]PIW54115.1 MAG: cell division protein FtsQ [Sphingomonadales bacterium CG12_big_fil_rev_8_21_14_0_65_65_10]WPZ02782.1 FtsQ-type POTRA domain-containing protein [Blastomonas marina]